MRILVNALSAQSLSGKHVLYGHLQQLAQWTTNSHEFHVVYDTESSPTHMAFGPNVCWHRAPSEVRGWLKRTIWEATKLPQYMRDWRVDFYLTPSGTILPQSPVPQATLAQNPWCLKPAVPKSIPDRFKAMLQRAAYRRAQRTADLMIFNSTHMQQLYRRNAGGLIEQQGVIAYQAIDDDTHISAAAAKTLRDCRRPTILCVSVMARWKNCEALLQAVNLLRQRKVLAAVRLIGDWPEQSYRRQIEELITTLNLQSQVKMEGHVSREELHQAYQSARVYCLLSRCESFGIPAVEAQAFGTPVVGSNTCAMPEIGGAGGVFVDPGDAVAAADALEPLLCNDDYWRSMSESAKANAEKFRWELCSRPLLEVLSIDSVLEHKKSSRTGDPCENNVPSEAEVAL